MNLSLNRRKVMPSPVNQDHLQHQQPGDTDSKQTRSIKQPKLDAKQARGRNTTQKKICLRKIPKCANNGFSYYPPCINLLLFGTFFAVVCLTTPCWAYIDSSVDGYTIFGLWHHCRDQECTSIHDNLIQGKSVPAIFHFIQGTYCIGTVMSFTGLGILASNFYGKYIKMTISTHQTACCVLGISVVQQFVSLYCFATYFDELDFLYFSGDDVDFNGSYYCGVFALILTLVASFVVYFDKSMTKMKLSEYKKITMTSVTVDHGPIAPTPFVKEHPW